MKSNAQAVVTARSLRRETGLLFSSSAAFEVLGAVLEGMTLGAPTLQNSPN